VQLSYDEDALDARLVSAYASHTPAALAAAEERTMKKSPTQVVESFWYAFTSQSPVDAFRGHMAVDCEFVMPGAPPMKGEAQVCAMFAAYKTAFPDFSCETLHAIESGDTYAAETRFAGTHRGPLANAQGTVPPTGKRVTWQSADIVRVRDGKIASWHVYHDPIPLLAQLGVPLG
jgi:ketosteroid isomerase-like protein